MSQLTIFDSLEQTKQLDRVQSKILKTVIQFCRDNKYFHLRDLVIYCLKEVNCNPDSPSRILRMARKECYLDYKNLHRRDSFYEVLWIK